ncbi:hypothetical protein DYB28_005309, partial [Aphanomyces astaci]
MSLKQYYALKAPATPLATNTPVPLSSTIQQFMTNAQTCYRVCETVEEHTEKSLALLQEMEDRHVSVKTLTSALYESFETLLTELDALNVKVQSLEGPLPYFTRISSIAKAVVDYSSKDTSMYLAAYGELMMHALHTLRDFAVATVEAARDHVLTAISTHPSPALDLDEASAYYLHFHACAPACQALTRHLDMRDTLPGNESFLPDVLDTYVTVRTQLVTPVVDAYLTSVNQSTDIVSL